MHSLPSGPDVFGQREEPAWLVMDEREDNGMGGIYSLGSPCQTTGLQLLHSSLRPQLQGSSLPNRFDFSGSHNHSLLLPFLGSLFLVLGCFRIT